MLIQKASAFGRGARAVFPAEDIPAGLNVFWRESPLWNAFEDSDPPGLWIPLFAHPPASGPSIPRHLFSAPFQTRLSDLLSSTSLTSRYHSPTFPFAANERTSPTSSSISAPSTTRWTNSSSGVWDIATNWSAGVPTIFDSAVLDAAGAYVVTSASSVDIKSLVVDAGATLSFGVGSPFIVEGDVVNNGAVKAGSFPGDGIATGKLKGDVTGTGSFEISDKAILEIEGSVSGHFLNGSFSGIVVSFDTGIGTLVLDQSAKFHGLIAGSSPGAALSPANLIDLKDLPFTSSMSATVHYDNSSNISVVDFSNGAADVALLFSGMDSNWNFKSDGQGGTIVSDPPTNPIVLENQKPGTPKSVWQIQPGDNSTLTQGFATAISTDVGGTVQFKINNLTGNPNYHVDVYRLGYYGGDGARLVTSLQHQAAASVVQPAPLSDPSTGLVDAGNWSVTDAWSVPTDAVSGVYIASVINGTQIFQIPFVIRNDASHSDIVLQTSDEDWQAYNGWGGANLYFGNGPGINGSAYAVSYNRPLVTRDGTGTFSEGGDSPFTAEFAAIQWLEQNGYDVSYISGIDAATNGSLLLNHKVFMDAGHDEYWTEAQRANVEAAAHAGVNLAFLTANEIFWKTRLAPSIDGSGTANRTLISYKDTHANALIDPSGQATGNYSDPRFSAPLPSNELTGTLFAVNAFRYDTITIPYSMTQLRFWRNTAVGQTSPGQTASLVPGLLGVEWDVAPDNGFRPAGLVSVSSSTVNVDGKYLLDYGNTFGAGTATHNLVLHRDPVSGALIFSAGSINWPWALASDHDGPATPVDPNVQQAMVNLFADMGIQPATLQANLVAAIQSTDTTAPTSAISNLSATSVVEGQSITVTGTATDTGGKIAGVEISTDGGATWHPANSNVGAASVTWSYTFVTGAQGTYSLKTRAVDDSLNLQTPGTGTIYTVTPSSSLTLFSPTDTPAVISNGDSGAVEVGLKFVSTASGKITGIRFYKALDNTGTHIGDLWTTNGTLLASATFSNETASGWQQVDFATPVNVQAGVTYVASYHTNTGHYSSTDFYFIDYDGITKGALTAPGSSLNGVYAYGSSPTFPSNTSSIDAANYWVDVVFTDSGATSPQAHEDSGFTVSQNGVLNIAASTLLANDTNPSGLAFSISSVGNAADGSVSYNSQNQTVTFTPTAGYAGAGSFTYTITDTSGQTGTGQVSLKVNYPASAQSLFGTNDAPSVPNGGDTSPIEVGVKFTASVSGTITGLRFYKGSLNTGPHIADLWSSTGTLLATATFTNETASGWQQVNFSTPVAITAGTTYVASYHTNGNYSGTQNYFTTSLVNGQLTALAGSNGVYAYGSGSAFPTNTYKSSNYWVDVVFNGSAATSAPQANADSGFTVSQNGVLNIAASTLLANDTNASGLAFSLTSVSNAANGSVSYNSQNQTVTFTPTASYAGAASFSYTITDTSGQSGSGQVSLKVNYPASAQSLFGTSAAPSVPNSGDSSPVEVGVKFTASVNGTITGLRFYKGSLNTGPHIADLWSSTGTLLATATFTGETASGWQQVNFSSPVAITAGTTFVASYHTNGNYSGTQNDFATSLTNGQLTAPAGSNGVYIYGAGSAFPTNSFKSSNYWVDVVFNGSTAANNTPPTAVADGADAIEKGGANNSTGGSPAIGNVLTNDIDPDSGDTKTVTAFSFGSTNAIFNTPLAGAHGTLLLSASGAFTYTVNENDAAVQALRQSSKNAERCLQLYDAGRRRRRIVDHPYCHHSWRQRRAGAGDPDRKPGCDREFRVLSDAARRHFHRCRCRRRAHLRRNFGPSRLAHVRCSDPHL
ncbi:VCBS repeat-containing protein [Bradyrhizobium sp. LM6.9]